MLHLQSLLQLSNMEARKEATEQMSSKIDHTSKSSSSSLCNYSHDVVAAAHTRTKVAMAVLMAESDNYKDSDNSKGGVVGAMMVVVQGEELSFFSSFLTRTSASSWLLSVS